MSVVLYVVGAIAVMLGVAMVGYGIPINEFSFGNTLIVAGTTAAIGGLIVGALGVAVAQLQRLADALGGRAGEQPEMSLDTFEPPPERRPASPPGRIPFPPKPRAEAEKPMERPAAPAPVLRNPEISVVEEYKETFLADEEPMPPPEAARPPAADQSTCDALRNTPNSNMRRRGALRRRHHRSPSRHHNRSHSLRRQNAGPSAADELFRQYVAGERAQNGEGCGCQRAAGGTVRSAAAGKPRRRNRKSRVRRPSRVRSPSSNPA